MHNTIIRIAAVACLGAAAWMSSIHAHAASTRPSAPAAAMPLPVVFKPPMDLNGDGRSEVIWRDGSNGALYGSQFTGSSTLSAPMLFDQVQDPNWQIAAVTDLNGDGKSDIVWRNASTGEVWGYLQDGFTRTAQGHILTVPYQEWQIVGSGDFNGDGRGDLVWRSMTGDVFVMLMDGLSIVSGAVVYSEPSYRWQIHAVGDFNHDGKADLAWRNTVSGEVYLMFMNGLSVTGGQIVYGEPSQDWQIVKAADFNGDGYDDLLWRNAATGAAHVILVQGANIVGSHPYPVPSILGEPLQIAAVGDFDADKRADILWKSPTTGQFVISRWNLWTGLLVPMTEQVTVPGGNPNPAWSVLGLLGPWL